MLSNSKDLAKRVIFVDQHANSFCFPNLQTTTTVRSTNQSHRVDVLMRIIFVVFLLKVLDLIVCPRWTADCQCDSACHPK